MSNTTDFLAYAIGGGANVRTPAAWAGDATLAQGLQAGILPSITLNTALRQSTTIAAMIAKFTADYGPSNVLDNGNIATLEAQFIAAITAFGDARYQKAILSGAVFYVNGATGNDTTGDGLTAGTAWATITKAVAVISKYISASGVTVNVATGTYAGVYIPPSFISSWNFVGSGASSCTINGTATTASQGRAVLSGYGANVTMTGSGFVSYYENVNVQPGGSMILNNCNFTQGSGGGNPAVGVYGYCQLIGTCNFANATYSEFLLALQGGNIRVGYHDSFITQAVTLNFGTSTVTNGTVMAQQGGSFAFDPSTVTFSGTVTGPRFNAVYGGSIGTAGSGLSYIPGSSAGTAPTGYYF